MLFRSEEIAGGFRLVEGSGELRVDGELLCEVERGRLIVVSDEGKPLGQAARLQLLASEPTKVRFTRPVALVEALQEGSTGPVGHFRLEGEAYEVDLEGDLARYVVRVSFEAQ